MIPARVEPDKSAIKEYIKQGNKLNHAKIIEKKEFKYKMRRHEINKTNVYGKLSKTRFELQNKKLKRSGHNKFAGFKYYELGDILPTINELSDKYRVVNIISYNRKEAIE